MLVHDLRNPLVGVLGAFDLVEAPAQQSLLDMGREAAKRIKETIDDVLRVSMIEGQGLTAMPVPGSVNDVAAAAVRALAAAAESTKVVLTLSAAESVIAAFDRKLMQRALENLIGNALRYTKDSVDVSVSRAGEEVTLSVGDRGPGVPEALKPGLFEKYGSVAMRKSGARSGHGIGLYLVSLVAQAHRGRVEVLDREGGGAVFRLTFPA
jgi:signal transduction histidine kinase